MLHLVSTLFCSIAGLAAIGIIVVTVLDHADAIVRTLRQQPMIPPLPAIVSPRIRVLTRPVLAYPIARQQTRAAA